MRCDYDGEVNESGNASGFGKAIRLGVIYEGTFYEGKAEGICIIKSPWGNREEGEMKAGKRHGKSTSYYASGQIYNCVFKNGSREHMKKITDTPKTAYYQNGNILRASDKKWIRHVRETSIRRSTSTQEETL